MKKGRNTSETRPKKKHTKLLKHNANTGIRPFSATLTCQSYRCTLGVHRNSLRHNLLGRLQMPENQADKIQNSVVIFHSFKPKIVDFRPFNHIWSIVWKFFSFFLIFSHFKQKNCSLCTFFTLTYNSLNIHQMFFFLSQSRAPTRLLVVAPFLLWIERGWR